MRTTQADAPVRLYHLDPDTGAATTLVYAPLAEALALAAQQPEDLWPDLWIQTRDDIVPYTDLKAAKAT